MDRLSFCCSAAGQENTGIGNGAKKGMRKKEQKGEQRQAVRAVTLAHSIAGATVCFMMRDREERRDEQSEKKVRT